MGNLFHPACSRTSRISFSLGSDPRKVGWLIAKRLARVRPMMVIWSPNKSFWNCRRLRYSRGVAFRIVIMPCELTSGIHPSVCWCFSTRLPRKRTTCSVPFASKLRGNAIAGKKSAATMACRWSSVGLLEFFGSEVLPGSAPKTRNATSLGKMPISSRNALSPPLCGESRFLLPCGFNLVRVWD